MKVVLLLALLAAPVHKLRVTAVEPIVVTTIQGARAYVIDLEGTIRTCPDVPNVGVFVRLESLKASPDFHYIAPPAVIMEHAGQKFTVACLKVE